MPVLTKAVFTETVARVFLGVLRGTEPAKKWVDRQLRGDYSKIKKRLRWFALCSLSG